MLNSIEKLVYNMVKRNTKLKNFLRDTYQGILSIVPTKKKNSNYEIIEREGYFFGFHDKIPWSRDNSMLLAHKFDPNRMDDYNYEVEIGYFSGENYTDFNSIAKTSSWNWQQGSMLQWVDFKNKIIFNRWNGERNVSRIVNIFGDVIRDINAPIGTVNPTGEFALSYSFERLNIGMPGYGYVNENYREEDVPIPKTSGLSVVNLNSGQIKKLFSIYMI